MVCWNSFCSTFVHILSLKIIGSDKVLEINDACFCSWSYCARVCLGFSQPAHVSSNHAGCLNLNLNLNCPFGNFLQMFKMLNICSLFFNMSFTPIHVAVAVSNTPFCVNQCPSPRDKWSLFCAKVSINIEKRINV